LADRNHDQERANTIIDWAGDHCGGFAGLLVFLRVSKGSQIEDSILYQ